MARIRVNGADLFYEEQGRGAETIVFAHGLLWSGRMFDAQVAALRDRYRCVAYDFRGQGRSEVTRDGYDMETLYGDSVALVEAVGQPPCHFVGLSMGGFIGMRIAARRPELLRSLVLLETTADPEPPENVPRYRTLAFIARWLGLRLVARRVERIMFGRTFLADPARASTRAEWRRRLLANHRTGIARATGGVIDRAGVAEELSRIRCPTLVVVGDEDVATVPAKSERIAGAIAGSTLVVLPRAGHSSTIEEPAAVNAALGAFLGHAATRG